jgi:hypothetical protein
MPFVCSLQQHPADGQMGRMEGAVAAAAAGAILLMQTMLPFHLARLVPAVTTLGCSCLGYSSFWLPFIVH